MVDAVLLFAPFQSCTVEIRNVPEGSSSQKVLLHETDKAFHFAFRKGVSRLAQLRLEHAMKERKIQEKLRENALEEFKKELEAAEQQEINELVTFRFGKAREREE